MNIAEKPNAPLYNKVIYDMFRDISHDLKTPLSCIMVSLEMLTLMKDTLSPEQQTSLLEVASLEAKRLDDFITDILSRYATESHF